MASQLLEIYGLYNLEENYPGSFKKIMVASLAISAGIIFWPLIKLKLEQHQVLGKTDFFLTTGSRLMGNVLKNKSSLLDHKEHRAVTGEDGNPLQQPHTG